MCSASQIVGHSICDSTQILLSDTDLFDQPLMPLPLPQIAPRDDERGGGQRVGIVELREQPERERAAPPAPQGSLPRPDLRPIRNRRLKCKFVIHMNRVGEYLRYSI